MLRESIKIRPLRDPTAKYMTSQVLGHSKGGRPLVVSQVRLIFLARMDRENLSVLREGTLGRPLEDPSTKSMISQVLGRAWTIDF